MTLAAASFTHAALTAVDAGAWRSQAACAQPHVEPANWFPAVNHAKDLATRNAVAVCAACPVQAQCLVFALIHDTHRDRGIFGGRTAKERTAMRASLQADETMPIVRVCANPACRRRFQVRSIHVKRENVCCSDACRKFRRHLLGRWATLNRTP